MAAGFFDPGAIGMKGERARVAPFAFRGPGKVQWDMPPVPPPYRPSSLTSATRWSLTTRPCGSGWRWRRRRSADLGRRRGCLWRFARAKRMPWAAMSRAFPGTMPDSLREAMARIFAALDLPPLDDDAWPRVSRGVCRRPVCALRSPGRACPAAGIEAARVCGRRDLRLGNDAAGPAGRAGHCALSGRPGRVGDCRRHQARTRACFKRRCGRRTPPPETSLHVGDWYELDVCGARAAGMQALLFDWPGRRPDADCPRVTTFAALADILLALPAPD